MGFRDVHLTHGPNEKGKDFIAKFAEGGQQWVFQSKKGNIDLATFRDDVHPQLLECAITSLQHPNFDPDAPRVIVLVATGVLSAQVNDRANDLIDEFQRKNFGQLEVWSAPRLTDLLLQYGLEGLRGTDHEDVEALGRFLELYGKAVRSDVTTQELERHSQSWCRGSSGEPRRRLIASLEVTILSQKLTESGGLYEAVQVELSGLRAAMVWLFRSSSDEWEELVNLHQTQLIRVLDACASFVAVVVEARNAGNGRLDHSVGGTFGMVTYPVLCSRFVETCGLLALAGLEDEQAHYQNLLQEMVNSEPGCWHPISDKFAVSVVLGALALWKGGKEQTATLLIEQAGAWIAERYDGESGLGLATVDDTVEAEIQQFLGSPFDFLGLRHQSGSLVATALIDLAAVTGMVKLYGDLVNDFKAVHLCPQYYQAPDTDAQFFFEGEDLVFYSNSAVEDELDEPGSLLYADHAKREPEKYRLAEEIGHVSFLCLAMLLRDRWFLRIVHNLVIC
jgi:hypothetical protein